MPCVTVTPNLKRHVSFEDRDVTGETVRSALDSYFQDFPGLRSYILDEHGALRRHIAVMVNGESVTDRERLDVPVQESDEIYVMQALSGG